MLMCSVGGILKNYNVVIAFEDLFVLMFTIFNVSKHVLQALAVFHYSHCNSEMFLTYQQIRKDEGFFFFFFSLSFFSVVEKAVGLQFTPAGVQA